VAQQVSVAAGNGVNFVSTDDVEKAAAQAGLDQTTTTALVDSYADAQLVSLKADISKGLTTAKKLPEFRAQVTDLESRLANLKAILPEAKDAADLLNRMQTVAAQSNMTIKGFKPAPTVTKQLHAEWPITLELEGNYHNLAMFFDRVGKFTRIVNISGLDVKGKDKTEGNSTITATCTATTFVLLDKPNVPAGRGGAPARGAAPPAGRGA